MNSYDYIALTLQGLEDVLAQEIADLGGTEIQTADGLVRFKGDKILLYRSNIHLRTALRVLKLVVQFKASESEEVFKTLSKHPWEQVLTGKQTFNIQADVRSNDFKNARLLGYKVKEAITTYFDESTGKRPSVRLTNPDILLFVHVIGDQCVVSIDSSGESLSNRGYRVSNAESAISEVMAAGLLLLSGWDGRSNFFDPMCGSGTLLIEAALIALNIPPGLYRKGFAFENWADFDSDLLDSLLGDESEERTFSFKIIGSDSSRIAMAAAERTIKNASLSKHIELRIQSIQSIQNAPLPGLLVTCPPYGDNMRPGDILAQYEQIGDCLKHSFTGYTAWVLSTKEEALEKIGLRASERIRLKNNNQDCDFRRYDIFKGRPKFSDSFTPKRR